MRQVPRKRVLERSFFRAKINGDYNDSVAPAALDMGNGDIREFTQPSSEEIKNARRLATVLPQDVLTDAMLICRSRSNPFKSEHRPVPSRTGLFADFACEQPEDKSSSADVQCGRNLDSEDCHNDPASCVGTEWVVYEPVHKKLAQSTSDNDAGEAPGSYDP
jgi:hypothetical protein